MSSVAPPLAGFRVLETATWWSGPIVGRMLAELGADVVKVEPVAGDPLRHFAPTRAGVGAYFANANHGKRSIVLDLSTAAGRQQMQRLLGPADVLVENWRPQVAARLARSLPANRLVPRSSSVFRSLASARQGH